MHQYKIEVIFRKPSKFVQHNTDKNSEITGIIDIVTDRCDIESILPEYNVREYKIIDCDYKVQVMNEFKQIPLFYYEEEHI